MSRHLSRTAVMHQAVMLRRFHRSHYLKQKCHELEFKGGQSLEKNIKDHYLFHTW